MYQNRRVKSAPLSLSISLPPSVLPIGTLKTGSVDMLAMKGQQTRIDHPPACSTVNLKKNLFCYFLHQYDVKAAPTVPPAAFLPSILPIGAENTGTVDMMAMVGQQDRIDHPPASWTVIF